MGDRRVLAWVAAGVAAALLLGGGYWLGTSGATDQGLVAATPSPTLSPTPSSRPSPTVSPAAKPLPSQPSPKPARTSSRPVSHAGQPSPPEQVEAAWFPPTSAECAGNITFYSSFQRDGDRVRVVGYAKNSTGRAVKVGGYPVEVTVYYGDNPTDDPNTQFSDYASAHYLTTFADGWPGSIGPGKKWSYTSAWKALTGKTRATSPGTRSTATWKDSRDASWCDTTAVSQEMIGPEPEDANYH